MYFYHAKLLLFLVFKSAANSSTYTSEYDFKLVIYVNKTSKFVILVYLQCKCRVHDARRRVIRHEQLCPLGPQPGGYHLWHGCGGVVMKRHWNACSKCYHDDMQHMQVVMEHWQVW